MELLKEQYLKGNQAYLLRNDGKLLDAEKGYGSFNVHPYIKYDNGSAADELINLIEEQPQFLTWFYKNTNQEITKNHIEVLAACIITHAKDLGFWAADEDYLKDIFEDIHYEDKLEKAKYQDVDWIYDLFDLIDKETNQEFLRIRTGGKYIPDGPNNSIYFRISSTDYNWFNQIWELVYKNKNFISTVNIVEDRQAGKSGDYYWHNGESMKDVPVDDFINLSGRPVFEAKSARDGYIQKGHLLIEDIERTDYRRMNRIYERHHYMQKKKGLIL